MIAKVNMQLMSDFVYTLKELMSEANVTALELSKSIAVSNSSISAWLREERMPTVLSLDALARHFGVSFDYIFGLTDVKAFQASANLVPFKNRLNGEMQKWSYSANFLGRKLGFQPTTISKWKNGKQPTVESVYRLAVFFGCSMDYLAGRTDKSK